MRRIISSLFIFINISFIFYADPQIELVRSFSYDNNTPFSFYETWGSGEGETFGGPHLIGFASDQLLLVGNEFSINIDIYNLRTGFKEQSLITGNLIMGSFVDSIIVGGVSSSNSLFSALKPINSSSQWSLLFKPVMYTGLERPLGVFYKTGKMIFAGTYNKIHSWEFKPDGTYVYRQPAETLSWLKTNGSGLGFEYRVKNNGRMYFGENSVVFSTVYIQLIELGREWNWPKDGSLDAIKVKPIFHPLGVDRKGIGYAYATNKFGKDWYSEDKTLWSPLRTLLIFDPWSMKVTYRNVPQTEYQILQVPYKDEDGKIGYRQGGRYEMQIHPSGDLYFFSANKKDKAYDLKRMVNDWWVELGVETKIVGRILGNHIPLYAEPNTTSKIVAYNYENEYVWIQEESTVTTTYETKPTVWVKVQKIAGTIGWMPKTPIVLPD